MNLKIVKELIAEGANINYMSASGLTALKVAIRKNAQEIAKYLLRLGADKEIKDDYGSTACMIARVYKDKKAIRVLDCE